MDPGYGSEAVEQFFREGPFVEVITAIEVFEEVIVERKVGGDEGVVVVVEEDGGGVDARDFFCKCLDDA